MALTNKPLEKWTLEELKADLDTCDMMRSGSSRESKIAREAIRRLEFLERTIAKKRPTR